MNDWFIGTPSGFGRIVLGLDYYQWQDDIFFKAARPKSQNMAICAVNGSGKTSRLALTLMLWWASTFPKSKTITTAGVFRQVKNLWQDVNKFRHKFPGAKFNDTDFKLPNGSTAQGFSTDNPEYFEGHHADYLLIIVDEAKSVADGIMRQ